MKDLSHMVGDVGTALIGGESSSAGNTINNPVTSIGPAPGSEPVNPVPGGPDSKMDTPSLEIPTATKHSGVKSSGDVPSNDASWKKV